MMSDKVIKAYDCVNGITYIGREGGGLTLDDWVMIETRVLAPKSIPQTYESLAIEAYQAMPRNKEFIGFWKDEQILIRHELPESL